MESSGRAKDDNARIYTEHLPKTKATCFSFYYHMYGATIGSLSLSIHPTDGSESVQLFKKSGNQGDTWHFQRVNVSSPIPYQVC